MRTPLIVIVLGLLVSVVGCRQDVSSPTEQTLEAIGSDRPGQPQPPLGIHGASHLTILGAPPLAAVGATFVVEARLAAQSTWWAAQAPVAWVSSDHSVATVQEANTEGPSRALVTVHGEGAVSITATAEGVTGIHRLVVMPVEPGLSDRLGIESFSVVELAHHDASTGTRHWYYAPRLVVSDQGGSGAHVYGVRLDVPGVGQPSCWSLRAVQAGGSTQLFREIYGDYELTVDRSGARAVPGNAVATVYFFDDRGVAGKVLASGPIVSGQYPYSYTGGTIAEPWHCGP